VFKVHPETEESDLLGILEQVSQNPKEALIKGKNGWQALQKEHSTEHYAEAFAAFLPVVAQSRAATAIPALAERFGHFFIADFPSTEMRQHLAERIAQELPLWLKPSAP
jgi:hypothetical protein